MKQRLIFAIILALTLGLAPFAPEPHIWKQFQNIMNGTFDQPIDWADLVLHGSPWIWLAVESIRRLRPTGPAN